MRLGVPKHTHAKVRGLDGPQIVKLVEPSELGAFFPADRCLLQTSLGWQGRIGGQVVSVEDIKLPEAMVAGDVVRLRPDGTLINVLWRRGDRSNTLFTTERCNSLCVMCSQPPRDVDDQWRVDELLQVIPLIDKDETQLGVTGGEPTLLGDGLTQVLGACRHELPKARLHVLTNGRQFRHAQEAKEWIQAGGQQTTWAVPLYADVADVHDEVVAAPGAFDETLDGLYQLAVNGAQVEIRVVLHAMAIPRLRQLAAFIYRRLPFVEHVALMGLEPMGFAKGNRDRLWIDPADYVDALADAVGFLANRKMRVSIYNLQLCILPRSLWPFARQSISEWKNRFAPPCDDCVVRDHCAGFFTSANNEWRSQKIKSLTLEELSHALA